MRSLSIVRVDPARALRGRLRVPGDKSIAHRYAMLAALAEGQSSIRGFAPGADCRSTVACLRRLGVQIETAPNGALMIVGRGIGRLCSPDAPLDAGNSGTTMRLLAGVLAGQQFSTTMIGDASLSRRPMRRVIAPLELMGARIDSHDGRPPLTIHGCSLHGMTYRPDTPSAQVKSAVLMAGLHADRTTTVSEPAATRDHTERAIPAFGGTISVTEASAGRTDISVTGGQQLHGRELSVPGDFSSAAFWLVAAAALPGSRIEIEDVGLNPTRTALLDVLRRFGARVVVHETGTEAGEPRGTIVVESAASRPIEITPAEVPGLIDELPAIGALAIAGCPVTIRGAAELRVKESDRIATLVNGFRALGLEADEAADGFVIHGGAGRRASGGTADAHGDHRMAMAFAIAGLAAERPSTIEGADAVDISYPGFFETLERLCDREA